MLLKVWEVNLQNGVSIYNYISDKGLVDRLLKNYNLRKKVNLILKLSKNLNKHFSKDFQMKSNKMEWCPILLVFKEIEIHKYWHPNKIPFHTLCGGSNQVHQE
jgi:hypothetical protein